MTEFISRKYGNDGYEVIIKTDSHEHYTAAEEFARRLIGHAKPVTDNNVGKWIPVTERLPVEREEDDEGEKHTASDIVQVAVMDSLGNKFVSDDMLYDGKWVNYPWGDFEITHWMPLPEPPKEVE